jgi:hypothetical protein
VQHDGEKGFIQAAGIQQEWAGERQTIINTVFKATSTVRNDFFKQEKCVRAYVPREEATAMDLKMDDLRDMRGSKCKVHAFREHRVYGQNRDVT